MIKWINIIWFGEINKIDGVMKIIKINKYIVC